ncbi:MAG: hypothetical protein J6M24_02545 [Lachnospiraceae bacterium]|nr:hypothetical protein [Lachnospiraceae bacterium]
MFNFEEELEKFVPSKEIDKAEESVIDSMNPDITDILESLLKENKLNEQ